MIASSLAPSIPTEPATSLPPFPDSPPFLSEIHLPEERNADVNSLHQYRREVDYTHLLTPEEVNSLAQCIERGRVAALHPSQPGHRELIEAGDRARNRLIEANLRLVLHVALRYKDAGIDLMDLIQEGNLGLMHAVEKYDWRKGYKFSSYAIWWIKQAIFRALTEQDQSIRVPLYYIEKLKQMSRAHQELEQRLEREPTSQELADHMAVSTEEVSELLRMNQSQRILSLNATRQVGEDEIPLSELLEDDQSNSPEQIILAQALENQIQELLQNLKPRERSVVLWRFGFHGRELNLRETGEQVGLSTEGVRSTQAVALRKLARIASERKLDELYV